MTHTWLDARRDARHDPGLAEARIRARRARREHDPLSPFTRFGRRAVIGASGGPTIGTSHGMWASSCGCGAPNRARVDLAREAFRFRTSAPGRIRTCAHASGDRGYPHPAASPARHSHGLSCSGRLQLPWWPGVRPTNRTTEAWRIAGRSNVLTKAVPGPGGARAGDGGEARNAIRQSRPESSRSPGFSPGRWDGRGRRRGRASWGRPCAKRRRRARGPRSGPVPQGRRGPS